MFVMLLYSRQLVVQQQFIDALIGMPHESPQAVFQASFNIDV